MYLKSLYPPVPPLPDMNVHYMMNPPEAATSPADHLLYVEVATGRKMMKKEFFERVYDGATALATPPSKGGLGINGDNGEIVGILSHNCIVSPHNSYPNFETNVLTMTYARFL